MDDRDAVGQALVELSQQEASALSKDPKRTEALLRARCPSDPQLVSILVAASYAGMPEALRRGDDPERLAAQISRYTGVERDLGAWAIGAWARAVGPVRPGVVPDPGPGGATFATRLFSGPAGARWNREVRGRVIVDGPDGIMTAVNLIELNGLANLARRQATTLKTEPGYRELGLGPIPPGPHRHVGLERTYLTSRASGEPTPWLQRYLHHKTRAVVLIASESLRWMVDQVEVHFERVGPPFNAGLRIPNHDGYVMVERLETTPPRAGSLVAASRPLDAGIHGWLSQAREKAAQAGGPLSLEEQGITLLGGLPGTLSAFGPVGSGRPSSVWAGGAHLDRAYFVTVLKPVNGQIARQYLSWFELR